MRLLRQGWIALALLSGCMGETSLIEQGATGDKYAPCIDALKCCTQEEMVCTGDPDTSYVCGCASLWDCSKNPKKCEQKMPTPSGGGDWNCAWTEGSYECKGGKIGSPPGGGGDWKCDFNLFEMKWVCKDTTPPNPSNKPEGGGVWSCTVNNEQDLLQCDRVHDTPPGSTTPETPGTSGTPGTGTGTDNPGTSGNPGNPGNPGTGTPDNPGNPPAGGGGECAPGDKMWCDGLQYCGWGQVVCGPDGKWKTRLPFGLGGLDCQELADGRRPNTQCACYHTFFKPECCETPDCIVPQGTNGQICPKSPGHLCDYCNPMNSECVDPGASCIVTTSNETFCGRGCSTAQPCPGGYKCFTYQSQNGVTSQCVPEDHSCFR
jgi:hypothetical protein